MPSVITVRIPDELAQRLEPLKGNINISEICRSALDAKARTHEQIQDTLSQEDVMKGLVQRLMIQKSEALDLSNTRGAKNGWDWAIRIANYAELDRWGPRRSSKLLREAVYSKDWWLMDSGMYEETPDGTLLVEDEFPDSALDILASTRIDAQKQGWVFEYAAYKPSFLNAVHEVWDQVKDKLGGENAT